MPSDISAAAAGTWKLGDFTINRMGFGAMRTTANPDTAVAIRVLRRAVELGVNHIDTAAFYRSPGGTLGVGEGPARFANELIREALAPYPEGLVITTKVGPGEDADGNFYNAKTAAELRTQVEQNLRQLGKEVLDVVNLRIIKKPGEDSIAERFGALADLRDQGLIRQLGISNVQPDHLDEAQAIAPVVCVQNFYSLDTHSDDDAFLKLCGERGVAYVPFFAIAGTSREGGATADHSEALQALAKSKGVTEQQLRLSWTLHQGTHVLAIPGTGNPAHLEENIAAGAINLTPEELASLS
ncbi:MAG TPA: aldo/keto reductase [Kribbella sp.]|uniref:aldo/keto reductase n=1 Tax=Kribbella sp. TaxID=1871183 RepID=UPI002D795841|nr:aldo/keto reductase [Kribbella sp.]HET6293500.1 aldo/keto reductase [Kribbella sp.]